MVGGITINSYCMNVYTKEQKLRLLFFSFTDHFWPALATTVCLIIVDSPLTTCLNHYTILWLFSTVTRSFGPGFVPISRCTVTGAGNLNCSVITDASCDHSMDLGVVCSTYEQLYNELLAQQSTTDPCCTSDEGCASTPVLGGVVGVLVTVLVVLVIGWSLSCVALVKRNSHSQKQTQ